MIEQSTIGIFWRMTIGAAAKLPADKHPLMKTFALSEDIILR